jgi:large subunit ribosomal protein L4e
MQSARPLVNVYSINATPSGIAQVMLAAVLTAPIRPDVVRDTHKNMAKNSRQAYAVAENAGHQHSAESWGTGRAVSRIPRVGGGGTSRSGQAAFGNMCRKGRMFAPTKTWRRWHRQVNRTQRRHAVASALAASTLPALVMARGHKIDNVPEFPLVISNDAEKVAKTKDAYALLKSLGAADDVDKAKDSKQIRRGKGKMRNRRFTMRRGPLIVYKNGGSIEKAFRNLPGVELASVDRLNLLDLAPGGHVGRFVIWTQGAFEALDTIFGTLEKKSAVKKGYTIPRSIITMGDVARVINSDEVQSVVRAKKPAVSLTRSKQKRNPLKNLGAMVKLNPYALVLRRAELLAQEKRAAQKSKVRAKKTKAAKEASKKFYTNLIRDD